MSERDIALIYFAAREMEQPWRTMVALLILTGASVSDIRALEARHIDWANGTFATKHFVERPAQWEPLSDLALQVLSEVSGSADLVFRSSRKGCAGPIELRPSIRRALQEQTETSDWSWYDLVKSVRARIRSIDDPVHGVRADPTEPDWRIHARARANAWANGLGLAREKALAARVSEAEIVL